jgi:hypothetical protein
MILNREDIFRRMMDQPLPATSIKRAASRELQSQVEAFIASGGRITEVPTGLSGECPDPRNFLINQKMADTALTRNRRNARKARAVMRQSSELGVTAAAQHLGISLADLEKLCAMGKAPKYTTGKHRVRKFHINDLDAYMRGAA